MQYTNLFLETSVLYTTYPCIFRNIRAINIHDLTMYFSVSTNFKNFVRFHKISKFSNIS